jgi:hypothetical protein
MAILISFPETVTKKFFGRITGGAGQILGQAADK